MFVDGVGSTTDEGIYGTSLLMEGTDGTSLPTVEEEELRKMTGKLFWGVLFCCWCNGFDIVNVSFFSGCQ